MFLSTKHILQTIADHADTTALVLLPGIQYYTGQAFDIVTITQYAHSKGIVVGWDLAHAVGNIELSTLRTKNYLYGPELADRLMWLEAGTVLRIEWAPDVIVMGSFTTLIGGMPAAQLGSLCAHGGAIVMGCPTVLIG